MRDLSCLDLFSGIGGFEVALRGVCRPVAYCDLYTHAVRVLRERMSSGDIPSAEVCPDVKLLGGSWLRSRGLPDRVDMVVAGFPCVDISIVNKSGRGLDGDRSGLVYEALRVVRECGARVVFLENTNNIVNRGLDRLSTDLKRMGFTIAWTIVSAAEVGAVHRRKRWWCLALRNIDPRDMPRAQAFDGGRWWRAENESRLMSRSDSAVYAEQRVRMRLLGNSVVPACAAFAYNVLLDAHAGILPALPASTLEGTAFQGVAVVDAPRRSQRAFSTAGVVGRAKNDAVVDLNVGYRRYSSDKWATPRHNIIGPNTLPGMSMPARYVILINQMLYDTASIRYMREHCRLHRRRFVLEDARKAFTADARWIEWLMGYRRDWTSVRSTS